MESGALSKGRAQMNDQPEIEIETAEDEAAYAEALAVLTSTSTMAQREG